MRRLRRSREQVYADTIGALVGATTTAIVLGLIFADLPILGRLAILAIVVALYLGLVLVGRRRARHRTGGSPLRLAKAERQSLEAALSGDGRLPAVADESWRPSIRHEAIGQGFIALWVQYAPLLVVVLFGVPVMTGEADPLTFDVVHVLANIGFAAVMAAAIAGTLALIHRPRVRRALGMLDQLDARAADRADT